MIWTKENVDRLVEQWNEGAKGEDLAAVFGVSRGAISGKVDRLRKAGIALRERPNAKRGKGRKGKDGERMAPEALPAEPPQFHPRPVSILRRSPNQCPWVIGDPDGPATIMCGAPMVGTNYCEDHEGWLAARL